MTPPGWIDEFRHLLRRHRRWWLIPLVLALAVYALVLLITQAVPVLSPFLYVLY